MFNSSFAMVDVHPGVEVILLSAEVGLAGNELSSPLDSFFACGVAGCWLANYLLVNVMGFFAVLLPGHMMRSANPNEVSDGFE